MCTPVAGKCDRDAWRAPVEEKNAGHMWKSSVDGKCAKQDRETSVAGNGGGQVWKARVESTCGAEAQNSSTSATTLCTEDTDEDKGGRQAWLSGSGYRGD